MMRKRLDRLPARVVGRREAIKVETGTDNHHQPLMSHFHKI
jgi:hypothetical protein